MAKKLDESVLIPPPSGSGIQTPKHTVSLTTYEDRVWASISQKVNLGNYENIDVAVGATVSVRDGETHADAIRRISKDLLREHGDLLEAAREQVK